MDILFKSYLGSLDPKTVRDVNCKRLIHYLEWLRLEGWIRDEPLKQKQVKNETKNTKKYSVAKMGENDWIIFENWMDIDYEDDEGKPRVHQLVVCRVATAQIADEIADLFEKHNPNGF